MEILSIQVGVPSEYGDDAATDPQDRRWFTGFYKTPITGPVEVQALGLVGDGQADPRFHGGPDKAVLAYSADHYPAWRDELGIPEMTSGAFGENLTITGLTEHNVCIGDVYQVGEVIFQVTQPRQPCWKLARRWKWPELPKIVIRTNRCGWYFRVLQPGIITAPTPIILTERPAAEWTIVRANSVMYAKERSLERAVLADLPWLSDEWRRDLQ